MTTVLFLLVTIPAAAYAMSDNAAWNHSDTHWRSWTLGGALEILALFVVSFIVVGYLLEINDWLTHHERWKEAYAGAKLIACALWVMLVFYILFFRKT